MKQAVIKNGTRVRKEKWLLFSGKEREEMKERKEKKKGEKRRREKRKRRKKGRKEKKRKGKIIPVITWALGQTTCIPED